MSKLITPCLLLACIGTTLSMQGCSLSAERRYQIIVESAERAIARLERIRARRIRACNGDPDCVSNVEDEHADAVAHVQAIEDARTDNELQRARDAEKSWEEWLQTLPEEIRKMFESVNEILEKMKKIEVKSDGTLSVSAVQVLRSNVGDQGQGGTADPVALTPEMAVTSATSIMSIPAEWEQVYRLDITGSILYDFKEDGIVTSTAAVVDVEGIFDGMLDPGESFGLSSGTVELFGGDIVIRISGLVGSSSVRIYDNGKGFMRISGYTEHADEWNDTDMSDLVSLEIPVQLVNNTLVVSSGGMFEPGHLMMVAPQTLFADYNDNGIVNYFDIVQFQQDCVNLDPYADLNDDGVIDQDDSTFLLNEYNRYVEWNAFRQSWSATP